MVDGDVAALLRDAEDDRAALFPALAACADALEDVVCTARAFLGLSDAAVTGARGACPSQCGGATPWRPSSRTSWGTGPRAPARPTTT